MGYVVVFTLAIGYRERPEQGHLGTCRPFGDST